MATGNAKRFVELGVTPELSACLAAQITAGVGNSRALGELGVMPRASRLIATAVATKLIDVYQLTRAGIVPAVANEFAFQIGSGQPYLGAIATRGVSANAVANSGSPYQTMTRTTYFCRSAGGVNGVRVVLPIGWYVSTATNAETVQAGAYTTTCAIEYPLGTIAAVCTFGGLTTGSFTGGDTAVSDLANVIIPDGGEFAVRWWLNSVNGWCYRNDFPKRTGDGFNSGTTTADLTAVTTALGAVGTLSVAPLAVIGTTTSRSFLLIGDSLQYGGGTDTTTADGLQGIGARLIGDLRAFTNIGISSTRANQFTAANATRRIALQQYFSDVFDDYGINDCLTGATGAATAGEVTRIAGLFSSKRFYQSTMTPLTQGAFVNPDGSDQTLRTGYIPANDLNTLFAAGVSGVTGLVGVRAVAQNPFDANKWAAPGQTADGIHPTAAMYASIAANASGRNSLRS